MIQTIDFESMDVAANWIFSVRVEQTWPGHIAGFFQTQMWLTPPYTLVTQTRIEGFNELISRSPRSMSVRRSKAIGRVDTNWPRRTPPSDQSVVQFVDNMLGNVATKPSHTRFTNVRHAFINICSIKAPNSRLKG